MRGLNRKAYIDRLINLLPYNIKNLKCLLLLGPPHNNTMVDHEKQDDDGPNILKLLMWCNNQGLRVNQQLILSQRRTIYIEVLKLYLYNKA